MQEHRIHSVTPRRRYIAISISPAGISRNSLLEAIRSAIHAQGLDEKEARIRYWWCDVGRGLLVIRCSHLVVDDVRLAIAGIDSVEGKSCQMRSILVSGSLRKLKKRLGLPKLSS